MILEEIAKYGPSLWFAAAVLLFVLETIVPGIHFLWFGVAALVAGVLALHGLDVISAAIYSEDGLALDEFRVDAGPSGIIPWDRVGEDVVKVLEGRLAIQARLDERIRTHRQRRRPGIHQLGHAVRFDNDATAEYLLDYELWDALSVNIEEPMDVGGLTPGILTVNLRQRHPLLIALEPLARGELRDADEDDEFALGAFYSIESHYPLYMEDMNW